MRTFFGIAVLCAVGALATRQTVAMAVIAVTTAAVVWGDIFLAQAQRCAQSRARRAKS